VQKRRKFGLSGSYSYISSPSYGGRVNMIPKEDLTLPESFEFRIPPTLVSLGPLRPIEHTSEAIALSHYIEKYYLNNSSNHLEIAEHLISINKSCLYRWACILLIRTHLYDQGKFNGILEESIKYVTQSLRYGHSYSKFIKKLRSAMFQQKLSQINSESFKENVKKIQESKYEPRFSNLGCDYDQILNEKYLIHFTETSDDFDYCLKEVEIDSKSEVEFRNQVSAFFDTLNLPLNQVSNLDMRSWITDSTSMDGYQSSGVNRTLMRKLAQGDLKSLERNDSRFLRTVINVGPANTRDAWQCDIPTLFKVKKVAFVMKQIVSQHRYSAMTSPSKARNRRKRLKTHPFYVMTDFKKCGLTFPRRLFEVIGEVMIEHGLPYGAELISICRGIVYKDGKAYNPLRGSGLGNLNEVVTLAQCIWGDLLEKTGLISNAIFFNDDGVLCFEKEILYALPKVISFYKLFGMIINLEKSFGSRFNVFCEDYNSGEYDFSKRHLRLLLISTLYEQEFIWEQKRVVESINSELEVFGDINYTPFIPNEFDKNSFESIVPICLGGRKKTNLGGINYVLDYVMHPQKYLTVHERSFIPLLNKWIQFVLDNRDEFFELFYQNKRFKYRYKVDNPFNQSWLNLDNYDLTDINPYLLKDRFKSFERLYNERGLKNSKPKLKHNFGRYLDARRKGFFRRFWNEKLNIFPTLSRDMIGIHTLLEFFSNDEKLARNMAPPEFIGEGEIHVESYRASDIIYSESVDTPEVNDSRAINSIIALRDTKCLPNMSIRELTSLMSPRGESFFRPGFKVKHVQFSVPPYYSLFFRDKRYFSTIYYNLYGKAPERWLSSPNVLDLKNLRCNIYHKVVSKRAGDYISHIKTMREERIFFLISGDLVLDTFEKVKLAVDFAKEIALSQRLKDTYESNMSYIMERSDYEFVYEEFPELVVDFLADTFIPSEDYSSEELDSFDDYSRTDILDIGSTV
jgi:hypothetical protein